ncbi:10756_t:CDS:2 [Funneliformis geosporum]|uniref:3659_t:CDS:1 n=1 Tax=Funneliformis geosporum TaxID=1117311 RepID=A0A9W4T111_9GLOM|nr:3659_t:CDS:2 [Funneliformis geosporum]CAI2189148.1 10756_t:CDS:2 [Funneliformis geosporum]
MKTVSNTIPEKIVPLGKRLKTEKSMITILEDSVEKGSRWNIFHVVETWMLELTRLCWKREAMPWDYVHRNIQLSNILFVAGVTDYKYVLIDFEHASIGGL